MLSIILIILIVLAIWIYRSTRVPANIKHIPAVPLYKSILATFLPLTYDQRRKYLYEDLLEKHGVVRQYLNSKWHIVLATAEIAEKLFMNPDSFPKMLPSKVFKQSLQNKFMGENLVLSNGNLWKKYRKVVNKIFKKQFDPDIFINAVDELMQVIDRQNGHRVDMSGYLRRLTMEVLGLGLMDVKIDAILSKDALFNHHYHNVVKQFNTPLSTLFKSLDHPKNPIYASAYQSLSYLDNYFEKLLKERRERLKHSKEEPSDILSLLIQATEDDKDFTDKELRDNIMVFVLAGHDTTAFTLAVAIYFLCKHPELQEKARQEVLSIFGQPTEDKKISFTHEQLKEVPFIDAIIKESLRFFPSVARLPRRVNLNEFEVNGIVIPKNQILSLDTVQLQRSPKYWDDPDTFNPYRFYETSNKDLFQPFTWSAFGGGQRLCIGVGFSMMEQRITLALLLLNYKFKLSEPVEPNAPLEKSLNVLLSSSDVNVDFEKVQY